ncbi:MAG TPA: hypothetical protein VFE45_04530, partial [Coriobacteriia bacterium]|nr:hypothetical protein [Coriobacteriia bacterium]
DFYLATCGDFLLATSGDFLMAADSELGQRHRHGLRQRGHRRARSLLLVVLLYSGPLSWVDLAVAQHLPQASCQTGDRHLNFHETRDNLGLGLDGCCLSSRPGSD